MNNNIGPGFFRAGVPGTPTEEYMSVHAALSFGHVSRSEEPDTIVLANGMKLHQDEAIRQGVIDQEAAVVIAARSGTDKPSPFTREDAQSPEDLKLTQVKAAMDSPEGKLLLAIRRLLSEPMSPDGDLAFLEAARGLVAKAEK